MKDLHAWTKYLGIVLKMRTNEKRTYQGLGVQMFIVKVQSKHNMQVVITAVICRLKNEAKLHEILFSIFNSTIY